MTFQEKIVDGYKISYTFQESEKDNFVLVFLHGWGCESSFFKSLFSKNNSIFAFDFPGFGKSSPLKKIFSLDDYAKITANIINTIIPKGKKIIIIGHSFGGRVLLKMLENKYLSIVLQKAVFIGVPFYRIKNWRITIIEKISKILPRQIKMLGKNILYTFWKNSDYENLENNEIMKKTFQNIIKEEISPYLYNLKNIQTYFLWGENDKVTPLWFAQKANKEIKNAKILSIKEAGHLPFIDQPEITKKTLYSFLS